MGWVPLPRSFPIEEQYEVIGNHLCELEHDKDLLNHFHLHEEQREQGFQEMDSGRIPQI